MTPERWQQVDEIFQAAIELNPAERLSFLETSCAGDEELRREVESLITSDEQGLSVVDSPAYEVAAGLLLGETPELPEGHQISHYRILTLLGSGGMGEVYLAQDMTLGRQVALKLLPSEFTGNAERLRRFQQEARAVSALNHPNILTLHEISYVEDRHFIATEFVDGETLRQRLKRSRLTPAEALEIATQIGSALAAAHQAGIVHRDIKPENIMLRRDGYVKVLDFGLAKLAEQRLSTVDAEAPTVRQAATTPGLVMGTIRYMSPEQARGLDVDTRSDIFSFGVVLYEMIAGHAPFKGETTSDLIAALLKEEPDPLVNHAPNTPDELQLLISKTLRKKKEDRYQTISALLIDLKVLSREKTDTARNVRGLAETITGSALSTREGEAAATASSVEYVVGRIKHHPARAALIVAALAVIVAGMAFGFSPLINRLRAPSLEMKVSRIPNTEKSGAVAISPDGKYVAHVQQGLWVIHIATNSSVQIAPPSSLDYGALTFSKDGSYIFYVQNDGVLFQVPVLGGESKKVLTGVSGPISFAPDGQRFAFVRELNSEETALMIANVNGSGEQTLITRKRPEILNTSGPGWSPDGRLIAVAAGMVASNGTITIIGVDVSTWKEEKISGQAWQDLDRVEWLSDGSGLVVPGTDISSGLSQIWHVPYPAGQVRRITHDLNNYGDLSLTADSRSLVTIQYEQRNGLWIVPDGDSSRAKPVTASKHELYRVISWTPDGRIVYASNAGGGRDIWIMNGDGTSPKQLTKNAGNNQLPNASPDGRYILFSSNRTNAGAFNIWRMDMDGSNPIQLTHGSGEVGATCSPDGRWVIYSKGGPEVPADVKTLWKVPIDGGDPVPLTTTPAAGPDISPDGTLIATWYKQGAKAPWQIALIPLTGGPPVKVFDATRTGVFRVRWAPDGQAITYIKTSDGISNIWRQPVGGGPATQLTQFTSEQIEGFDWSRDGQLICSRGFSARDVVLISNFR